MKKAEKGKVFAELSLKKIEFTRRDETRVGKLLSKFVDAQEVLDLVDEICAGYNPDNDPWGKRKPQLQTFEKKLRLILELRKEGPDWVKKLEQGDVVRNLDRPDMAGLVEEADERNLIWVVQRSKRHGLKYWALVSPWCYENCEFGKMIPDDAKAELMGWLANWRNGLYDMSPPHAAFRAALVKAGMAAELPPDANQRIYPKPKAPGKDGHGIGNISEAIG